MEATTITRTEPIIKPVDLRTDWEKMSLFERSHLMHQGNELLEDEELSEEEFEIIAETEEHLKEKIVATAFFCSKQDEIATLILKEAEAYDEKAKALKARANVFMNRSQIRRESIKNALIGHNIKKIETPVFTISLRKKTESIVEMPTARMENLPEQYIRIKKEFNKSEIKKAIQSGIHVEGFALSEPGFSLIIK